MKNLWSVTTIIRPRPNEALTSWVVLETIKQMKK